MVRGVLVLKCTKPAWFDLPAMMKLTQLSSFVSGSGVPLLSARGAGVLSGDVWILIWCVRAWARRGVRGGRLRVRLTLAA
jgi:hypothetical protein